MAVFRAVVRFGANSRVCSSNKFGSFNYYSTSTSSDSYAAFRSNHRQISQLVKPNGKRVLVDTLALVRSLETQGFTSKQAEAMTAAITEVVNDSLDSVVQSSLEHHLSLWQREMEKLHGDIKRESEKRQADSEKMRSDLRYEIDKVTAGQRLDLNLERGRTRDELSNLNAELANLNNKVDQVSHALRAQVEAAKYDVMKYCIGTLVSISAVGLAVVRILM